MFKNYKQAKKFFDYVKFIKSIMNKEYNFLIDWHVWNLIEAIETSLLDKWMYDQKKNVDHNWKIKTRWIVYENFEDETSWFIENLYAIVVSFISIKILLIYVIILNLELKHFDFETVFLNFDIFKKIIMYVKQFHDFENESNKICRFKKILYDLRKSFLWWFDTIIFVLKNLRFEFFNFDLCLFKNFKTRV